MAAYISALGHLGDGPLKGSASVDSIYKAWIDPWVLRRNGSVWSNPSVGLEVECRYLNYYPHYQETVEYEVRLTERIGTVQPWIEVSRDDMWGLMNAHYPDLVDVGDVWEASDVHIRVYGDTMVSVTVGDVGDFTLLNQVKRGLLYKTPTMELESLRDHLAEEFGDLEGIVYYDTKECVASLRNQDVTVFLTGTFQRRRVWMASAAVLSQ